MNIAFIGTYPPRKCGIGTFTKNMVKAILANTGHKNPHESMMIVALNEDNQEFDYPPEVKFTIRQNRQRDYADAARYINFSETDLCILEHEFGIYGGDDGVYILPLLHRLEVPLIVTFHTVLKEPSYTQRSIVEEIGKKAARIVVMSRRAFTFLREIYHIPAEKIEVIEHGVPEFEKLSRKKAKERFGLEERKVLLTFGLLGRSKGVETVINALPAIVEKHPDVLYIVLGATHPSVLRHTGEEYRNFLRRIVKTKGLEKHVYFNNEFVAEDRLFEYLSATDVYITPYPNEAQITSGTLSYAVGSGCAVVSTPYWHAQELLGNGRGRLFDFRDTAQLASIVDELLSDPEKLSALREKSREYGKKLRWPKIGKQYLYLAEFVCDNWEKEPKPEKQAIDLSLMPSYDLSHVKRLTDDTGIVQHAKYGIPNLKEGYCVDDNSRALLMSILAWRQNRDEDSLKLMPVYLSFLHYMQREDGNFRNFLSFSRQFLDEHGSEDSFGRSVWALAYLIRFAPNDAFKQIGREIFFRSVPHFDNLQSLRGIANTVIGICYYLKATPDDEAMVKKMKSLVSVIMEAYKDNRDGDWQWFEKIMTYDNAILPLALFSAYEITGEDEMLNIAIESTTFLESVTFRNGCLVPVGNQGWYEKGGRVPEFDQQSIDVMAMVLMYYRAFQVTMDRTCIEKMFASYLWFLGENSLRLPLYDHETCGGCDGLERQGVNRNQGAESTLAYWISHLTVLAAQEKEHLLIGNQ
ncbi:MAG: glycosyltransferase [Marinilabiliales bacterium]|nr:MAG: glycosyltransferase [Marinilabiliales bacterium]